MNRLITYLFLIFSCIAFSQEDSLQFKIGNIQNKIKLSEGADKLYLLDSLAELIRFKIKYEYDTIVKETVDYAFEMDSIPLGLKHTRNYIYYLVNKVGKTDEAIRFYNAFLKRKIDTTHFSKSNQKAYARLQLVIGDAYYFSGKINGSIPFYETAERFSLKAKDTFRYLLAKDYKSTSYGDIGDYVSASKSYKEIAELARKRKDSFRVASARSGLATIYSRMGFFDEAEILREENIDFYESVHEYDAERGHKRLIAVYSNASIDAEKKGDHQTRIKLLDKALKHMDEPGVNKIQRPLPIYGLTRAYAEIGDIPKAKYYFNEMETKYKIQKPIPYHSQYMEASVIYYIAIEDFINARIAAEKALKLFETAKAVDGIFETKEKLAEIYKELGEIGKSYTYYEEANKLRDSVQSVQKSNALSYYQTLYETEKRDATIDNQKSEIALLDAQNEIKKYWLLFGGLGLLALFSIIYLTRSQKFAVTKQKLQEQFSQDLINEQEKERTRLSRELHDSVGQKLMLLSKQTKNLGHANMENLADTTLEEIRSISRGLHPSNLERLGLSEAINALVYNINANTDLFFTEELDNIDNVLSKEAELHLYRIIQETLSNIVKHADAKAVKMNINKTKYAVEVLVSDNGKGFDFETKFKSMSLGLKTLFERAKILDAQMNLESKVNKGTIMTLNIPI
ncbi:MAG: sensor histidine kinase [Algibacter sp.]